MSKSSSSSSSSSSLVQYPDVLNKLKEIAKNDSKVTPENVFRNGKYLL